MSWFACRAQRDFLAQKLEEVEGQLKEAKADRRESERERIMLKAVTNMKQLFTGGAHMALILSN